MFEDTYMTISSFARPSIGYMKYKGLDFAEVRGFWEVQNDYMGGPFVSHVFYSRDGKDVIVLQAFVYVCMKPCSSRSLIWQPIAMSHWLRNAKKTTWDSLP